MSGFRRNHLAISLERAIVNQTIIGTVSKATQKTSETGWSADGLS